jgi:hypothetical protein
VLRSPAAPGLTVLVGLQGISLSYRHPACALRAVGAQGCARELQSDCGELAQVQAGLGALDAAQSRTERQGLGLRLGGVGAVGLEQNAHQVFLNVLGRCTGGLWG